MKIVPSVQITPLLPWLIASKSEQVTSTTVPGFTGNCVVVSSVLVHSVLSPVHSFGAEDVNISTTHIFASKLQIKKNFLVVSKQLDV